MTTKKPKGRTNTLRRLARTAMHGLVRGAAAAAGSAIVAGILWWLSHR
jgi:hypothetical protein